MGHFIPASNWFLVWDHQVYPVKMGKPATAFRDLNHPLPWSMQPLECARPIVQCMPASPKVCSLRISPLIMYEGMRTEAEAPAAGDTLHSRNTYIYHVLKGRVQRIRRPWRKKSRTEEWTPPKEGEENIKEKQTERRWGGGGDTAHAFHNRQKLLLIHSGLATTGKGQPPHTVWLRAGCCLA